MEGISNNTNPSMREWSKGLPHEINKIIETMRLNQSLDTIVDCGAGEGRNSIFAIKNTLWRRWNALQSIVEEVNKNPQTDSEAG